MKKIIALIITAMLLLTFASCGASTESSDNSAGEDQLERHIIGVLVYDRADEEVLSFGKYLREYIGEAFNVEFLYSESARTIEESLAFINNAAEYGAEGILSFVSYDLSKEVAACESNNIYYMMASGTVSDEDFAAVEQNYYFLGLVGPGRFTEYKAGSDMANFFLDKNYGNDYFIFSGGGCYGNEMHLLRTQGILDTLMNAYGVTFDISSEEAALSSEKVFLSAGDLNVVVCPGYFSDEEEIEADRICYEENPYGVVLSVLPATKVIDIVKKAKLGVVDCYSETNLGLFNNGTLDYVCGKYSSIVGPSFAAMYNAITGHGDDMRENGRAFYATQGFWASDSKEDYNEKYILANSIEKNAYNYEDLQKVIIVFNPDATIEDLKALAEDSSYQAAVDRRG